MTNQEFVDFYSLWTDALIEAKTNPEIVVKFELLCDAACKATGDTSLIDPLDESQTEVEAVEVIGAIVAQHYLDSQPQA